MPEIQRTSGDSSSVWLSWGLFLAALTVLLAALTCTGSVAAQSAMTHDSKTPLYKAPRLDSPVIAEVPAGTKLELGWDRATKVRLLRKQQLAPARIAQPGTRSAGRTLEAFPGPYTDVLVLLPSKESNNQLWLPVRTPEGETAWVRDHAVELSGGFDRQAPLIIPLRRGQVPRLSQANLPEDVYDHLSLGGGSSLLSATLVFRLLIGPDGETKNVDVLSSMGPDSLRSLVTRVASQFRFEPIVQNGQPGFALLVLEFEISM